MTDERDRAEAEIVELHEFFEGWIAGSLANYDETYEDRFLEHLSPYFTMVQPGGALTEYDGLTRGMRGAHGSNPEFRIAITDVVVRIRLGDTLVVTYTEWQRNAKASKPANNGRRATVVFDDLGDRMIWCHVHESWLPPEQMAAGDYGF